MHVQNSTNKIEKIQCGKTLMSAILTIIFAANGFIQLKSDNLNESLMPFYLILAGLAVGLTKINFYFEIFNLIFIGTK